MKTLFRESNIQILSKAKFVFVAAFVMNFFVARIAQTKQPSSVSELPAYEHRWALIIGVGRYDDGEHFEPLSGDRDAKIIAKALVKYGKYPKDHVILLVNDNRNPLYRPTYKSINHWLNEISQQTNPGDIWLIAFSGHGLHLDSGAGTPGGNFIVPSDAIFSADPYFLASEMVNLDSVRGYLTLSGVRQTILLLDLCRETLSGPQQSLQSLSPTAVYAFDFAKNGASFEASAVLFATGSNQFAYQDQEHNLGFFSEYFVNGLGGEAADSHGDVTLSSITSYIKQQVPERAHHQFFEKHLRQPSQQLPDIYVNGYDSDKVVLSHPETRLGPSGAHPALTLAGEPIEISNDVSGPILSKPHKINIGGKFPNSVAVGDFNGDGKIDIVTANQQSNDVSVLLGKGDGTFQPALRFAAGDGPYSVTVGDFNKDGKLDIAVANVGPKGNPSVSILLGLGDGTFRNATNFSANEQPAKIVAADLNGDGNLDLIVANRTMAAISVLFGKGDGTFHLPISYPVDLTPGGIAVGKFASTADNAKSDLVVTNVDGHSLSILLNKGDGTFRASDNYPVDTGCWGPYAVQVGDFDSDGKQDLVITDFSNSAIGLLLGNGDGTFQGRSVRFPVGLHLAPANNDCSHFALVSRQPSTGPFDVAVADFNGDGKLDVATANNENSVSVLLGNGDGTFREPQNYPGEDSPCSIAVADLDGDGRPDVVTADRGGDSVSILMNISNQTKSVLTSEQNPSKFGSDITFTAKVATDFGPAYGYVIFKSDNYILGRVILDHGVATVDTYALSPGIHLVSALFIGSAQFGGSVATLTQTVTPK